MFGASLRTVYWIGTRSTVVRSIVSGVSRVQVNTLGDSTGPRQLKLTQCNALTCGALNKCAPSLLPINACIVATRPYATNNEQNSRSVKEDTKSQSILTRLLEEEQQPKALTAAERGVCCYANQPTNNYSCILIVVQAGKDTTYILVICIGFGITAVLLYFVFGELFSSNSVQRLFTAALTRIRADEKVKINGIINFIVCIFA